MKNNVKNSFNPIKKKSISRQLFINYSILFLLVAIIFGITNVAGNMYLNSLYIISDSDFESEELTENSYETIYENIYEYGIEEAFDMNFFQDGTYIELVNNDLTVIEEVNSPHVIDYAYSEKNFNNIISNISGNFDFYFSPENNEFLIIHFAESIFEQAVKKVFLFQLVFFIISLILVLLIYVKLTSKNIVNPINKLLKGVDTIADGQYDTKISFKCNNELDHLKDSINNMSKKINNEISLREESEKKRKQLILDISHDLKTPLTNILGYAETLLEDSNLSEAEKSVYLNIIASNTKKANNLIQDLFQMSQIDSEEYHFHKNNQDICEFMRETLINYIPLLKESNMDFHFDIPEESIMCNINIDKLDRAVSNLINNSIKYSGHKTKLTVCVKETGNTVKIIIKDTGMGINKKFHKTIFEPFVRTDAARNSKTGGTGLGLAITKKIIEKHGGTIELNGYAEKGCEFIIELPRI